MIRLTRTRGQRGWIYRLKISFAFWKISFGFWKISFPCWWRRYSRQQAPVEAKKEEGGLTCR